MTILFHEVWPYHAGLAGRRERYRPSIREFVDLARDVHDPARYEAAQATSRAGDRGMARVVRRARASICCSSPPCR